VSSGRSDEAVEGVKQALADRPENVMNRMFAVQIVVQGAGRADLGLSILADGVGQTPENPLLQEQYGLLLEATGSPEPALDHLVKAAELDPANPGPPSHIARILRVLGREPEAKEWEDREKRASAPAAAGQPR